MGFNCLLIWVYVGVFLCLVVACLFVVCYVLLMLCYVVFVGLYWLSSLLFMLELGWLF